ncbi:MAG: M23 family metallopeptidase [Chloroflexaceae bacterium]|nr:M23 family metallopeptidase [Chloroflexaceae bacterium]
MQPRRWIWIGLVVWAVWAVGMPVAVWGQDGATPASADPHTETSDVTTDWFTPALRLSHTAILSGTDDLAPPLADGGSRLYLPLVMVGRALTINFERNGTVPDSLQDDIQATMQAEGYIGQYAVSAIRQQDEWAYVVIVPDSVFETGWEETDLSQFIDVLAQQQKGGAWNVAIKGTDEFLDLARLVPSDFADLSYLFAPNLADVDYRFPWTSGQTWAVTQGWHNWRAIDFAPLIKNNPDVDMAVLAAEAGTLEYACQPDGHQVTLKIAHDDGNQTVYLHLAAANFRSDLVGQRVQRGQFLGILYNGTAGQGNGFQYQTKCGYGTAAHLHFSTSNQSITINGRNINNVASGGNYTSSNTRIDDNASPPSNPTSTPSNPTAGPQPTAAPPAACPDIRPANPLQGATINSRSVDFRWQLPASDECKNQRIVLRFATNENVTAPGVTIEEIPKLYNVDHYTHIFDSHWDNRDLYWAVWYERAGTNPPRGTKFRVVPNNPPSISLDRANGQAVTSNNQTIWSNSATGSFAGTASDPDGNLNRVYFYCRGDTCNADIPAQGTNNWSHTQSGMEGRNSVAFAAYDNQNAKSRDTDRHTILLMVDLAAPTTNSNFNGKSSVSAAWYREPVEVRLQAKDVGTRNATANVREVQYRINSGSWQVQRGSATDFTVGNDGRYTMQYRAVDNVGNQEGVRTVTFNIDRTPPKDITGVAETHGVVNNVWQKIHNTPTFTWAASSDVTSGVSHYELEFGLIDPKTNQRTLHSKRSFGASEARQWIPLPGGVGTGRYYLRGRVKDVAGNWSNWRDLFTFNYDNTAPNNPTNATHAAGITNDTWQNTVRTANFTWPEAYDAGSGIKGYYAYWGTDPNGTSTNFSTMRHYQSETPICGEQETCTGYLRLRSVDNLDTPATDWTTAFVLRYDNTPPTVDFIINKGMTETNQTALSLAINGQDTGSGVSAMRLSGDGQTWLRWEEYLDERIWLIPDISRQWWPVYIQVQDSMGLVSEVVSQTVYLDVNRRQPRSDQFRLFDYTVTAGSGVYSSTTYTGRGTLGQSSDTRAITSTQYIVSGGYEAGNRARPLFIPGHDDYLLINGVVASGSGGTNLTSTAYQMQGTLGEPALPNNTVTISSPTFLHRPGFLAAFTPISTTVPLPPNQPGITPTLEIVPTCEFPQISINNAAIYTSSPSVTVQLCAPRAIEMKISNDGGFQGVDWVPYTTNIAWKLTTLGQHVLPRYVYVAFKDADGSTHGVYFDEIIYDSSAPVAVELNIGDSVATSSVPVSPDAQRLGMSGADTRSLPLIGMDTDNDAPVVLQTSGISTPTLDLYVTAQDDNSGLAEMQFSITAAFSDTNWESYSALKQWTLEGDNGIQTVYGRFRDTAGNVSDPISTTFILDTLAPIGGVAVGYQVVGPDTEGFYLYTGALDNLSGVNELRISTEPTFADALWEPYTTTVTWPLSPAAQIPTTFYVQYRDLAGNISDVYSDTYQLDTTPPVVEVMVASGDTLIRSLTITATDDLVYPATVRLSNDPLLLEGVVTLPYTSSVSWTFDDRRVVWIQVADSVGNYSVPAPIFADSAISAPLPTATPTTTMTNIPGLSPTSTVTGEPVATATVTTTAEPWASSTATLAAPSISPTVTEAASTDTPEVQATTTNTVTPSVNPTNTPSPSITPTATTELVKEDNRIYLPFVRR